MNTFIVIEEYSNNIKWHDVILTLRMLCKFNIFYQVSVLIKEKNNKLYFTIRANDTFVRNKLLVIGNKLSIFIYINFFKPMLFLKICHIRENHTFSSEKETVNVSYLVFNILKRLDFFC